MRILVIFLQTSDYGIICIVPKNIFLIRHKIDNGHSPTREIAVER